MAPLGPSFARSRVDSVVEEMRAEAAAGPPKVSLPGMPLEEAKPKSWAEMAKQSAGSSAGGKVSFGAKGKHCLLKPDLIKARLAEERWLAAEAALTPEERQKRDAWNRLTRKANRKCSWFGWAPQASDKPISKTQLFRWRDSMEKGLSRQFSAQGYERIWFLQ